MKVETKMMAFTDITATAPDKITGENSVVAFRACGLSSSNHSSSSSSSYLLNLDSKKRVFMRLNMTFNISSSMESN